MQGAGQPEPRCWPDPAAHVKFRMDFVCLPPRGVQWYFRTTMHSQVEFRTMRYRWSLLTHRLGFDEVYPNHKQIVWRFGLQGRGV